MTRTKLFALVATVGLVLFAFGPGAATVAADSTGNSSLDLSVEQADAEPTVTVTDNDTAVENASVSVETADNGTYDGTGEYATGENGTVSLPAPEANVTVNVTATYDNMTASTTAELTVAAEENESAFGSRVSSLVQSLLGGNSTQIGQQVADFVTANNPGNAPDHAGPPADAGPSADDDRRGPPAHAGQSDDSEDNESEDENETDDSEDNETEDDDVETADNETESDDDDTDSDDADTDSDDDDTDSDDADTDSDDDDTDSDDADTDSDDDGDDGGPPEHARGNGR